MTKIVWGTPTDRTYETGLDRGVLYPLLGPGVAWNGLISVSEKNADGDLKPNYLDGVKYLLEQGVTDFQASMSAYTYPDEFLRCEGTDYDPTGFGYHNQLREKFGLSYRTKVGTPLDADFGYQIHLVYNALAIISDKDRNTINDTPEATAFKWDIETTPVIIPGRVPTAHFTLDSRKTNLELLAYLESILYGTASTPPRLPTPIELKELMSDWIHNFLGGYGYGPYGHGPYGVAS